MTARPTSIRILLADGTPDGIRFVDKSNWVGRALVARGAQLGQALQRGWIWDDDHIRDLLVSVARSFSIGAVMLLEAGGASRPARSSRAQCITF